MCNFPNPSPLVVPLWHQDNLTMILKFIFAESRNKVPERNKQQKAFVSTCKEEFDPVQWTISWYRLFGTSEAWVLSLLSAFFLKQKKLVSEL